jgi:hypothetical protein
MKHLKTYETHANKVKAIQDDGHWYVIPNDIVDDFYKDEKDEDFVDSGKFDDKYGEYRTGGDLNLRQLYGTSEKNFDVTISYNPGEEMMQITDKNNKTVFYGNFWDFKNEPQSISELLTSLGLNVNLDDKLPDV